MSLVDYASSSEEEEEEEERERFRENKQEQPQLFPSPNFDLRPSDEQSISSETPVMKLPDASLLLNASNVTSHLVSGFDHSSRVAAALAESASRKREANRSTNVLPRGKVPRGNLPHSRSVPDTGKGLLVPPQLSGRSNVVTEDISKLFSRKNGECTEGIWRLRLVVVSDFLTAWACLLCLRRAIFNFVYGESRDLSFCNRSVRLFLRRQTSNVASQANYILYPSMFANARTLSKSTSINGLWDKVAYITCDLKIPRSNSRFYLFRCRLPSKD